MCRYTYKYIHIYIYIYSPLANTSFIVERLTQFSNTPYLRISARP